MAELLTNKITKMGYYNSDQIKTILENLGYSLSDKGREWRAKPLYRDSDNESALSIKKDSGFWIDFARNYSGRIEDLVERTLKKPKGFAENWLKKEGFTQVKQSERDNREELPIVYDKFFDKELLKKLSANYKYWVGRGISKKTLQEFGGGLCCTGRMNGRYVFPVFDENKNIRGFAGRSIYENNDTKWKLIGKRSEWSYPLFLTREHIETEKKCIIVESIGDGLKLWEAGVKNFIISFGLNSLDHLHYCLISLDPERIIISFNDDYKCGKSSGSGNFAAKNFQKSLFSFFNKDQVEIKFPTKNDFGEMTVDEIKQWKNN